MRLSDAAGLLVLVVTIAALGYAEGARACQLGALSDIDQALAVIWRLVPLAAVGGLLTYIGGLLWLDFVRRSWAAHRVDDDRGPRP